MQLGRHVAGVTFALGLVACSHPGPDQNVHGTDAPDAGGSDIGVDAGSNTTPFSVVGVPLAGCFNTHTVTTVIGGQSFALNVDTGSSSLGVAASNCAQCTNVTPLYTPGATATDLHETVSSQFDTGELGWSGEGYEDTVAIGGLGVPVDFAAIAMQTSYFFDPNNCPTQNGDVPANYEGIIGFGPEGLLIAGTTQYQGALAKSGAPDVFALDFCNTGGELWLGGYDPSVLTGPMQYTDMDSQGLYSVDWTELTIGSGAPIAMTAPTAMLDSGGAPIIVPDAAFNTIASTLEADPNVASTLGATWFSATANAFANCVTLTSTPAQIDALLPPLEFTFGATNPIQVTLQATESYLLYYYVSPTQVTYCQNVIDGQATYGGNFYYLGQTLMNDHVVVHDRANHRVGFAPTSRCGT